MKYIKKGFLGAKNFKYAVKIWVHSSRAVHGQKNCIMQKCVQNTCCILIYIFLGPRIKLSYTCSGPMHMQKNCKNVCKIHDVYQFKCFWSQEFKICNQNFHTLAQGPCTFKQICKNVCKYMLHFDLYVFGARNFKNATKTFIQLLRVHAHGKKLQKCVQNTCWI